MNKQEIIGRILDCGVVAVVRAEDREQAVRIAEACAEGGVAALEITFTVPGAEKIIEYLSQRYQNTSFLIGAGTVLDTETAPGCPSCRGRAMWFPPASRRPWCGCATVMPCR